MCLAGARCRKWIWPRSCARFKTCGSLHAWKGWVSLFDPEKLATLLGILAGGKPVAIICLGHVEKFYPKPMLELEGWAQRRQLGDLVSIDRWDATSQ